MNYANEIKAMLDKMSTDLHQELKADMVSKLRYHIKQMFTKHLYDKAFIMFDPTTNEPHYLPSDENPTLVIPKKYYYSTIKWLEDNGFHTHVNASHFPKIIEPKRVNVTIQL